jgi:glycosyltransferase involved in cell wall biosynthesis
MMPNAFLFRQEPSKMKVAFYAPMKPPTSPAPSGDRLIGRLLISALKSAEISVELMSQFRSYDGKGDSNRQKRLQSIGLRLANRIVHRLLKRAPEDRPSAWLTYHLYHKAPDWIGPLVSQKLAIPYVVVEASFAPKQATGSWQLGHTAVFNTLANTGLAIGLNSQDATCVIPCLSTPQRYKSLRPFLDSSLLEKAGKNNYGHRRAIADELNVDYKSVLLLTVAMMRPGDKVQSYEILAQALRLIEDQQWALIVVGSGSEELQVRSFFSAFKNRIVWLGKVEAERLATLYSASDIFVWPAVKESPGMCFLEAMAAGTPVIGGDSGGVPDIVEHNVTGLLAKHLDVDDFTACVKSLIVDKDRRRTMGAAGAMNVARYHRIESAGQQLKKLLSDIPL